MGEFVWSFWGYSYLIGAYHLSKNEEYQTANFLIMITKSLRRTCTNSIDTSEGNLGKVNEVISD